MDTKTKSLKPAHASDPGVRQVSRPFFQRSNVDSSPEFAQRGVQAKLNMGRRGDKYEREADAVADVVVSGDGARRMPAISPVSGSLQREAVSGSDSVREEEPMQRQEEEEESLQTKADSEEEMLQAQVDEEEEVPLQRQAIEEEEETVQAQEEDEESPIQTQPESEEEETLQAQPEEEEEPVQLQATEEEDEMLQAQEEEEEPVQTRKDDSSLLQAQRASDVAGLPSGSIEGQLRAEAGRGSPLTEDVRTKLEGQLGVDFSGIRIHTDDVSIQLTRLLNAQAFTRGNDIYFNRDRFAPHSREGEHLLAHELTHTVQQGAAARTEDPTAEAPSQIQRQEDDASSYLTRPELLEAIRLARTQIGKVNAKKLSSEGTRIGWERLYEFFFTAFGEKEVIHEDIIKYYKEYKGKDALPSWCGIFVWWSLKKAGLPIPDWKLGVSIAGNVVKRQHGELPRKGDIAYMGPDHFDHFAIVSGVESPETAAGKDYKSIKVATVNGNTAGDDHLGGQVQEKWHPIGAWLAFFNPIAKLDLPPVELVRTGQEPDEPSADEQAAETAAKADEPAVDTPLTDVSNLDEDIVTEPSLPAEGASDVAVDLPPPPAPPPAEEVAAVEELGLEGSSDEAMVGFTEAKPSQMAKTQPVLGEKLDSKIRDEKKQEVENAPVLTAETSGKVDEGLTPPDQIPVPADTQLGDGVKGDDPGALKSQPHEYKDPTPNNDDNEEILDKKEKEGGFLDWLKSNIKGFMNRIRTKDPSLNTSAGKRPNVKLEGEADPARMETQRTEADTALKSQRDTVTDKLKNHPGQKNIQPKQIKEDRKAELKPDTAVSIETKPDEGAKDYVEAPLSADVRAKADELLQPDLESHLADAKTKTQTAADTRDTDKATAVKDAEDKATKQNQQADKEQRDIVVANRKKVADQQKAGIEDAYGKVNAFNNEADTKQQAARKEIGTKVTESEEGARVELEKGEKNAENVKKEGEEKAANEKQKLEQEQKKESWWDRATGWIKDAVKAVTKAIDGVFNWVREQVAKAINAAKELAIGLINAARDFIKKALNTFRDWAKGMVDKYLKEHFPGLAAAINEKIDAFVDTAIQGVDMVADAAIAGVEALADALAKALDDILAAFQTGLKAAVQIAGAVLTGDFAEALRIAIQAGCDIAGIDSGPIFDFFDRAKESIMKILKDPKGFFNNLVAAIGGGIRNFVKNIKQHLIKGLIGWLTGAISEAGITLPETFDVKGIFSLVMQILGLTYENIKARLIKKYPPAAKVIDLIEKGFEIVKRLVTEGPSALWEMIKEKLANLKETVIGGVRDWVITTVIKEGIVWLLSLLNPAGALAKVLKLLFDFVMFLVERFEQIKDFVLSVYESLTAIASGALGKAMAAVENALSRSVPVVISLLANLIGLGGIGKTVKKIIGKVTAPINKLIDKVIDKIIAFAKKIVSKVKGAAGKAKEKVLDLIKWWTHKIPFKSKDGGGHKVYYKGKGAGAKLVVASKEMTVEAFLAKKIGEAKDNDEKTALSNAKTAYGAVTTSETEIKRLEKLKNAASKKETKEKHNKAIKSENNTLRDRLVVFSKSLTGLNLDAESDLAVKTEVRPTSGSRASSVEAKPLTYLPGNTVGSTPRQDPPGWAHAVKIDTDPKTNKRRNQWVRGHLLNEHLHGPGETWNLVPITQKTNSDMKNSTEKDAKSAVSKKGTVIYYRTAVTFHVAQFPVNDFPASIRVTWGHMERQPGSTPPSFNEKSGTQKTKSFSQDMPPAFAGNIQYNLNKVGRGTLVTETGISHRFGMLIKTEQAAGDFTNFSNFETRMRANQAANMDDQALFDAHVKRIQAAEAKGTIIIET